MSRQKIDRTTIPEGFTLGLALVDALPVLFFGASMLVLGSLIASPLFLLGALLCLWAGAAKVLWKIIVALKQRNIWWLFVQMRIVMPIGMVLMLAGLFFNRSGLTLSRFWAAVSSFPAGLFFLLGFLGMCLMGVFAKKLDSADKKANWIEQLTNAAAQACFLIGLLILRFR